METDTRPGNKRHGSPAGRLSSRSTPRRWSPRTGNVSCSWVFASSAVCLSALASSRESAAHFPSHRGCRSPTVASFGATCPLCHAGTCWCGRVFWSPALHGPGELFPPRSRGWDAHPRSTSWRRGSRQNSPTAQAVLNQPGVQESRDGFLKGTGRFDDLVNVNAVKSLAAVAHDLLSENPQLCWRHQLLAWDGGQVEEEKLSRLSSQTGQVLHGFWKKTNCNVYGKLWLFESMPVPCTLSNLLFTLIDRMWLYWPLTGHTGLKRLKSDNLSRLTQHDYLRGGKLTQRAFLIHCMSSIYHLHKTFFFIITCNSTMETLKSLLKYIQKLLTVLYF